MIFGQLELETKVQTMDRTRLNCVKSFTTPDEAAVTLVRIKPSVTDAFITVASGASAIDNDKYYLDWMYLTAGMKTVELEITTNAAPQVFTNTITVLDKTTEILFSNDNDLFNIENDILKFVPVGKNSFIFMHRQSKEDILEEIYRNKILDVDGEKLTEADVIETTELNYWSKYKVLAMIFEGLSNAIDDIFDQKAKKYSSEMLSWQNQTFNILRLDYNNSGEIDSFDKQEDNTDIRSGGVMKR